MAPTRRPGGGERSWFERAFSHKTDAKEAAEPSSSSSSAGPTPTRMEPSTTQGDEVTLKSRDSFMKRFTSRVFPSKSEPKETTESVLVPDSWRRRLFQGAPSKNPPTDKTNLYPLAVVENSKKDALQRAFESSLTSTKDHFHKTSASLLNEATVKLQASKQVLTETARASAEASNKVLSATTQLSKDVIVKVESGVRTTLDASKGAINQVQTSVKATAEGIRAKPDQLAQSIRMAREDLAIKAARRAKQVRNFAVLVVVSGCFAFGLGIGLGAGGVRRKFED